MIVNKVPLPVLLRLSLERLSVESMATLPCKVSEKMPRDLKESPSTPRAREDPPPSSICSPALKSVSSAFPLRFCARTRLFEKGVRSHWLARLSNA